MRRREKNFSGDSVRYSCPTYCIIWSKKNFSSSSYHHLLDMKHIRSLDIFNDSFNNDTGESKPVMSYRWWGSGWKSKIHKNYRMCNLLFHHPGLVCFFLAMNTPGRSAFNRIEHQMVKFCQELSRTVLLHEKRLIQSWKRKTSCMRGRSLLKSGWLW